MREELKQIFFAWHKHNSYPLCLQKQNAAGDESDAKSPEEKLDTEVETTLPQDEHQQEAKKAFKRKNVNPYGEWEAVREEEE